MPDMMPPGVGSSAAMPPVLAALHAGSPGQPPFGSSPLTMPVPNRGEEVKAAADVIIASEVLKEALQSLEPGSELFRTLNKAFESLQRAVSPGQVTPGIIHAELVRLLIGRHRQSPLLGVLAAHAGQPQPPQLPAPTPPPNPAAAGAA